MSRPIRVAHLLATLRPSGAEVMLREASEVFRGLGVAGIAVAVAPTRGPFARQLEAAGYEVRHVDTTQGARSQVAAVRAIAREVDLVHVHAERASLANAAAARSVGTPVVRSIHSLFRHHGWLRLERTLWRAVERRLGVVQLACGDEVARHERAWFRNPVAVARNWIDVERFPPPTGEERDAARRRLGVPAEAPTVAVVGNCAPVKNHEALLEALGEVPDLWLLHAGADEDGREWQRVEELGLSDRVRYLGPVEDVTAVLHAADLYAMPSRIEGAGLAAMEALATGLPALLSDRGGLRDHRAYLAPSAARWVEPTSDALAEGLRSWSRGDWGQVDRAEQHEAVRRRFDVAEGAARWVEVYRRLTDPP